MRPDITSSKLLDSTELSGPLRSSLDVDDARSFRVKRALAATGVTQAFNIVAMILGLVSVPLYLDWLGEERYGLLLTGLAYGGFLMFADAGLSWSSMLLISQAKGRNNDDEIACIVRASIVLAATSSTVVFLVVSGFYLLLEADQTFALFPSHPEFPGLFLAVGMSTVASLGFSAFYNVFIGFQEGHIAAFYQGCGRLSAICASLIAAASGASLGIVLGSNVACVVAMGFVAAFHCVARNPNAFSSGDWWQPVQFRNQFRTGVKSFMMQFGNVLVGSAPIITISRIAGTALVPTFTIPLTLINTPLSLIQSLHANLQAAYGEAIGANDHAWIASTVSKMLRQTLILICFLIAGFLTVSRPFIELWTGGRMIIGEAMQWSVAGVAACLAINSIFRFALSGMNRHRLTGITEIAFGVLSIVLGSLVASNLGIGTIGVGIVTAYISTCGWILPRQLSRQLGHAILLPSAAFIIKLVGITVASLFVGKVVGRFVAGNVSLYSMAFEILIAGVVVVVTFISFLRLFLNSDFRIMLDQVKDLLAKCKRLGRAR